MKVGIVSRLFDDKFYVNQSYLQFFYNFGYEVELIFLDSNLDLYDLFVLPGGYDINPIYYNEKNVSCNHIIDYNDELDFKVIDYAYKNEKPLLGICRGLQSINVYFNGSLKQNIKNHKKNNHFIRYKNRFYLVNSFHHQSIKKIGNHLKVLATSLDNEIEIIKYKKITGVQFHPELIHTPVIQDLIICLINEV